MELNHEQLARELENEKRKSGIVRKVSLELGKIGTLETKVAFILELLETNFSLKHSMLLVPNQDQSYLTVLASRGFTSGGEGAKVKFGDGVAGVVAKNKKKLRLARLSFLRRYANALNKEDIQKAGDIELPGLPDAESQVAIPLLANEELVAVLSVESADLNFFSQEDEDFLVLLSQQMALLIQNTLIYSNLEEQVALRTAKIESQRKELEKSNATKDKLFSIISHDLRSPIASLQDISELFQYYREKQDFNKLIDLGYKVSNTAASVGHLLDNLLSWSLNQRGGLISIPQAIHLGDITAEVVAIFKEQLESKKIVMGVNIPASLYVKSDKDMTMLIIRNVLSNAIKFSYPEGSIKVLGRASGNEILLSIQDKGTGISPERLNSIFTPGDNKSTLGTAREKGTGLGLLLVKEFMELNHGHLEIESEAGKGTLVRLTFIGDR